MARAKLPAEKCARSSAGPDQGIQRRAERHAQIRAGVAIGDRKHVDSVEHLLLVQDPVYARRQSFRQFIGAERKSCARTGSQEFVAYSRGSRKRVPK